MKDSYEEYRKLNLNLGLWDIGLVLAANIILMCFFETAGFEVSIKAFVVVNVFAQTTLMAIAYAVAYKICNSKRYTPKTKNLSVLLFTSTVCSLITITDFVIPACAGVLIIPVFIAAGFGQRFYANIATGISFLTILLVYPIGHIAGAEITIGQIETGVIMGPILVISRVLSEAIMSFNKTSASSIQMHENAKNSLEGQLLRDAMTGLYNHASFYGFLGQLTSTRDEEITSLSLAVIDIDNFKKVNDTYGHSKGDEVILYLAELLSKHCGDGNYVCRYGGEEFAVIFINHKASAAKAKMEGVLAEFSARTYSWKPDNVTFSCGICEYRPGQMTDKELFGIADKVLYRAKNSGKNQVLI